MADPLKKILEPIKELQNIRGIDLPIGLEFLQLVVTGPPGAGKSHYIEQIRGWPNEGYLDLTQKGWWKNQSLIFRPREVHLGLPFQGIKEAVTVFDKEWLKCPIPPELDLSRIRIPPARKHFFQSDWRERYIFEFLIPSPTTIYEQRLARQSHGYFPVDENLSLEMVRLQVAVYREVALYLHRAGLNVFIRKSLDKPPMVIAEKGVATVPPWTLDRKPRRPSLKTAAGWKWLFRRRYPIQWITLGDQPQSLDRAGRIAHDGRSFDLLLANSRLRFLPEIPLGLKKNATQKNWIINTEQGCSTRNMRGFIRIRVGETIVIGQAHKEFSELFQFGENVAKRHVSVTNRKGDLIITPLVSDRPTQVMRHDDLDYREQLERGRYKTLLEIKRIYGQAIVPLAADNALRTIKDVNRILKEETFRPLDKDGNPGGLVEIPPDSTPVIVGDLHAQVNNLLKILSENCLLDCLRMKTATLIILGDAVHSEMAGEMARFETSMLIMDLIFRLKLTFPGNVFYIKGNHDSFAPEINKNGILQGELFRETLLQVRGNEYVQEMRYFYDHLPCIILSDSFIACHAGPPRAPISRDDLINIDKNSNLAIELTNTRLNRPHYFTGYSKSDVKQLRKSLDLPPKTRFIVGHTPMDPFGSFWLHAGNIKNHHIIYSAHSEGPSLFIRTGESFSPITFPAEPLIDVINDLI
ncbi:MAG: serine/threonine protein phosphatase [Desulfobulbaceae bacterium BRH_c16a]|nr:MAG: serine/threonine protein phosphatase [Desulfobulbaceae bacterium BRH_c16a]